PARAGLPTHRLRLSASPLLLLVRSRSRLGRPLRRLRIRSEAGGRTTVGRRPTRAGRWGVADSSHGRLPGVAVGLGAAAVGFAAAVAVGFAAAVAVGFAAAVAVGFAAAVAVGFAAA